MDNIIFLKGTRIHLRALMEKDLTDDYLQWLNDDEVCRNNSHAIFPNTESKMKAYFENIQNQQRDIILAIIHTESGKHIGNISLQNINWISRNAEFAILLGNKSFWGGRIGEEAGHLIIEYGFSRLNLHRIYCAVFEEAEGVKKFVRRLKMIEEGIRREAIFKNGRYQNITEFGVLRNEYFNR